MTKANAGYRPKSLTQYFEAPEGFSGRFGWLCGYSGDSTFLNIAAERFMGQTCAHRANGGQIGLALMLDPGNPQITIVEVPGVLHLPMRPDIPKEFKLLHAKVALLGFGETDGDRWRLRLIVSTGNWTRDTLDSNVDLAWTVDLGSEDMHSNGDEAKRIRADVVAARELLWALRKQFDARLLEAKTGSATGLALACLEKWCNSLSRPQGIRPRFMYSRKNVSLLAQLVDRIPVRSEDARHVARNHLSMGSGFYEAPGPSDKLPGALRDIVDELRKHKLLTAKAVIKVVVNPSACQAIATCIDAIGAEGWTVHRPEQPVFLGSAPRFMHAKFIFSANVREGTNNCTSPWIYLGSGNLTRPGFTMGMSAGGGNLEAGVVFASDGLQWSGGKDLAPAQVVGNLLPISRSGSPVNLSELAAGAGMEDREMVFVAAPIGWLAWDADGDAGPALADTADEIGEYEVLDDTDVPCARIAPGRFKWPGEQPRQARVRWGVNGRACFATVPVLDHYGRIGGTALASIELDAAWWQLDGFPMPVDPEDSVVEADQENRAGTADARPRSAEARYPVRDMMQLIENIAARQTALQESDWTAWCIRVEQTLKQAAGSATVVYFREVLKLNPLSPLREAPFRPAFAEHAETECGLRYDSALRSIEIAWGVDGLDSLGALV